MTMTTPAAFPPPDDAELAQPGIASVGTERFHVGPYLYANLADAIVEAGRGRAARNDP